MSLIVCPECKNEISEYANSCPNCGCPMDVIKQNLSSDKNTTTQSENLCYISGVPFDLSKAKEQILNDNNRLDGVKTIRIITGLGLKEALNIADYIKENHKVPNEITKDQLGYLSSIAIEKQNKPQDPPKYLPKCPTCNSPDVEKIGGLERGVSVFTIGIFSKKINKSYKCNNCGYMW